VIARGRIIVAPVATVALTILLAVNGCAHAPGAGTPAERPLVAEEASTERFDPRTREDRAALFDWLLEKAIERDAFASLPNHPYYQEHPAGVDVESEMLRYRDELIAADTEEKLYYALLKISNVRRDRHLRVFPVEGGLTLPDTIGIEESQANSPVQGSRVPHAPVRLRPDYATPGEYFLFVADRARDFGQFSNGVVPGLGDRVISINGTPVDRYREEVRDYHRVSTENSFWWQFATWVPQRSVQFPRRFYGDELTLELERRESGERYHLSLPYLPPQDFEWEGHSERRYPGFSRVEEMSGYETYDLYLSDDDLPVILLDWYGFRSHEIMDAMDALMAYAEERNLLDHHVIVDATRSRGGGRGAYAVQRLQPRPFRTTFGNLKVSDAMEEWVEDRIDRLRESGAAGRDDEDGWLLEWFETDVRAAIAEGARYTNTVPFKTAHLPKWADGIIDPAPVHFRGQMVVLLGPKGGSHLDQFASQIVDNDLAHVIGMPAGGYSNTWQVAETLRFPTTGRPIIGFMWSMGHSIRPNGEVLQYNPADVHEYIPQTADNYFEYHPYLLRRAFDHLGLSTVSESSDGLIRGSTAFLHARCLTLSPDCRGRGGAAVEIPES